MQVRNIIRTFKKKKEGTMKQIMDFSDSRWAADSITALEVETEFIDALEDAICGD